MTESSQTQTPWSYAYAGSSPASGITIIGRQNWPRGSIIEAGLLPSLGRPGDILVTNSSARDARGRTRGHAGRREDGREGSA
jgi:hypothetical protein